MLSLADVISIGWPYILVRLCYAISYWAEITMGDDLESITLLTTTTMLR